MPDLEPMSGDEDEEYDEPRQRARRNTSRSRPAAGTTAALPAPITLNTAAGTATGLPAPTNAGVTAGATSNLPPVMLNNPDERSAAQQAGATDDLAWFFETNPLTGERECRVCRYVKFVLPFIGSSDQVYYSGIRQAGGTAPRGLYKKSTGGGNMRDHIEKKHLQLYLDQAAIRGWSVKRPSQARSRISQASGGDPGSPRPDNFSTTKLNEALVNLITADDQV